MDYGLNILNFRDLGGLATTDGSIVKPGLLFRSAELERANAISRARLVGSCRVSTVIDLRTRIERNMHPDPDLPAVRKLNAPLVPMSALRITLEDDNWRELLRGEWDPDTYDACAAYRKLASPRVSESWQLIFRALLDAQGRAVLWHCTNGKDRTGVVTAVILKALGVPDKAVREEYLQSNAALSQERERILTVAKLRKDEPGLRKKIGPLLEARPEYLNAFLDAIDEHYDGFEGFLEDVCQLSYAEDDELRRLYLQ